MRDLVGHQFQSCKTTNLHLDFLPQPIFRVMGFSVMGRVLNSQEGEGVPDATVTLNNQIKGEACVDAEGWLKALMFCFGMFASHVCTCTICVVKMADECHH